MRPRPRWFLSPLLWLVAEAAAGVTVTVVVVMDLDASLLGEQAGAALVWLGDGTDARTRAFSGLVESEGAFRNGVDI